MDDGTERGKEEGNERNEEPARCPLPAAREAQFPKQHHGAWQTPGHGWIGGGYNSGSIGDVCWDGALAITEQKHPRPILVSLVSQARGRCGVGASSPFCDSYFFQSAALPSRPSLLILVDTESSQESGIDPLGDDVWRSTNQPTRALRGHPACSGLGEFRQGLKGGATPCKPSALLRGWRCWFARGWSSKLAPEPTRRLSSAVRFLFGPGLFLGITCRQ